MRLLLDTCTFLWIAMGDQRLSKTANAAYLDIANQIFLSAVSCAEIAAKVNARKLVIPLPPDEFIAFARDECGVSTLALDEPSALHVARLPALHRDPFDRLLVAQAIVHGMVLVTPDEAVRAYPARTMW